METSLNREQLLHQGDAQRYPTIVIDPPWPYADGWRGWGQTHADRTALPYPPMTLERIAALPVRELVANEGYVFLWTTNRYLEQSYGILRGWNLCPKQTLTWGKEPNGGGVGGLFATTTEFVVVAQRVGPSGKSHQRNSTGRRVDRSHFDWPRQEHSRKPEAFLDHVETVCLSPRLEMFARRNRLGWDTWGNQSLEHLEVAT